MAKWLIRTKWLWVRIPLLSLRSLLIFSASRRRRDIKIQLHLSAPVRKSLIQWVTTMDACASARVRFWPEIPFLRKFGPKYQNCHFKLKFGMYSNSNMENSMVIFNFSIFDWKYPFWVNLVQKFKIVSLSGNLVPRLIWICRIQWWYSPFLF